VSLLDLLRFAGLALVRHRLRSALSLLGVAIGVTAVVLLTAVGEGARRFVSGQFESLGTNLVIVIPGKNETEGAIPGVGGAANDLTLADADALRREVPQAHRVVPVVIGPETVAHHQRSRQVLIIGTTHEFLQVRRLSVRNGSFLPAIDPERSMPVVVLGEGLVRELFGAKNPLGEVVRVGDWRMRVIGVLESKGTQLGMDTDEIAVIPVGSGMRLFDRSSLFRVLVDVRAHAEVEPACERALEVLKKRHDDTEDVTILTQDSVLGAFSAILRGLTAAVAGIAAISLTVAGIGIMNVMLVSVSERTGEVGLLKALGATSGQVLAVFLTEAVLLSTAGGLLGLLVGGGVCVAVQLLYAFPLQPPLWAVVASLGVSVGSGALFGVLPARRATRLDPVEALSKR
jgi:putative ABC transport system permease protein